MRGYGYGYRLLYPSITHTPAGGFTGTNREDRNIYIYIIYYFLIHFITYF